MLSFTGFAANGWADGYQPVSPSNLKGLYFTVKHALTDLSYSSTAMELRVAVASDFDYSDLDNFIYSAKTGYTIDSTPADFSEQGALLKVRHTAPDTLVTYKLYIRKAIASSLPLAVTFGSVNPIGNYHPDSVKSTGWTYSAVAIASSTTPQLMAAGHTFILAYNAPATQFKAQVYGSNNNPQAGIVITIDASADGVNWDNLKTFNNDVPPNSATGDERYVTLNNLQSSHRYVRLYMVSRTSGPNITINAFSIINDTPTNLDAISSQSGIFVSPDNVLKLGGREVADIAVYSISGSAVRTCRNPSQDISLNDMHKGVYVVRAALTDGTVLTEKVIIR